MKKIILISFLALTSLVSMAQDNYADAVKTYIQLGTSGLDVSTIPAELLDIVYSVSIDEFKANGVTIDDLNAYSEALQSEAGQQYLAHTKLVQSQETQDRLQKVMTPALMPLMMGGEMKAVDAPEVPANYKAKYHKFYVKANIKSQFDALFGALEGMLQSQPDSEKVLAKMHKFFDESGENLMLTVSADIYTEEDLDFATQLASSDYGKRIIEAGTKATPKVIKKMMEKLRPGM